MELPIIYKQLAKLDYLLLNTTNHKETNENNSNTGLPNENVSNDVLQKPLAPNVPSKPTSLSPASRNIPWVPPIPKPVSAMPFNSVTEKEKVDLDERTKFWKEVKVLML